MDLIEYAIMVTTRAQEALNAGNKVEAKRLLELLIQTVQETIQKYC